MRDNCRSNFIGLPFYKWVALCPLLLISILLQGLKQVNADEKSPISGTQWLALMTHAMRNLNYQGTVVYLRDNKVEAMKMFHAVVEGVEQERLVSLNDPMREIIRDADKVTCYFPDSRTMVVDYNPTQRSLLVDIPENLEFESQRYRIVVRNKEHVVQRLAQVISVDPVDNLRYGRKIWIDLESKVPLKHEVFDENGQMVEQMVFTSFSVKESIPLRFLSAETKIEKLNWQIRNKERVPAGQHAWVFKSIPEGFKQVLYTRRKMPGSKQPVEHILLSDGFASVSIYVDQVESQGLQPLQKALGAINSYSIQLDSHQITVMGEVPAKTVKMIGEGIEFKGNVLQ